MLLALFSMVCTGFIYGQCFGYPFGIGLILLVFVHELGHAIAAWRMGLRIRAMVFLPGLAFVSLRDQPRSLLVDSIVGLGGPLLATLAGIGVLVAGLFFSSGYWSELLIVLAWSTFVINLFNMIPLGPLDGRRISRHFRPWLWVPGCILMVFLAYLSNDSRSSAHALPMYILLLGVMHGANNFCRRRFHTRLLDRLKRKPTRVWDNTTIPPWQRRIIAWVYFGLAAVLLLLAIFTEGFTPPVDASLAKIKLFKFF